MKTWELGNEIWGDWVRGHSNAETYARNYLRYREAMLAVDPSIRLIAVGDNDMAWNRTVLGRPVPASTTSRSTTTTGCESRRASDENLMARPLHYERFYRETWPAPSPSSRRAETCG